MSFTQISLFSNIFLLKIILKDKFYNVLYQQYQHSYPQFSIKSFYLWIKLKDMTFVRPSGIGPESHPWQGRILPLNYDRNFRMRLNYNIFIKLKQLLH